MAPKTTSTQKLQCDERSVSDGVISLCCRPFCLVGAIGGAGASWAVTLGASRAAARSASALETCTAQTHAKITAPPRKALVISPLAGSISPPNSPRRPSADFGGGGRAPQTRPSLSRCDVGARRSKSSARGRARRGICGEGIDAPHETLRRRIPEAAIRDSKKYRFRAMIVARSRSCPRPPPNRPISYWSSCV